MTKEINIQDRFKFRVWDKNAKKYREKTRNQADTCLDGITGKVLSGEGIEIYGEEDDCDVVIEQCTGLRDKNGKLIYEGDIIRVEDNNCLITWDNDNARYNVGGYGEIAYLNYNEIEVIGNIHVNPDLLEKKDE